MSSFLVPGALVGRFRVEEKIGQGGMGVVFRARDTLLNRLVALKLIAPHLGRNPTAQARFHREAAAAAKLRHPHIATVYEYGEHEGQAFIAIEWVEGPTLKSLLDSEHGLPLDRALKLFDQIGGALDYAHQRGVVHRDIKPGNIIVSGDDQAVIVDFGLAWLADAPSITLSGAAYGTPYYMSPEQAMGQRVDGRSDLYSLGIVLYEMLSGQPPFGDTTGAAILHRQIYATPAPITIVNPGVPSNVEAALIVALAKSPAERFATAAEFGAALRASLPPPADQTLVHQPIPTSASAPAPAAPGTTSKPIQRRGLWWLGLGALGLCVLAGLVLPGMMNAPGESATPTAPELTSDPSLTPDAPPSTEVVPGSETPAGEETPIPVSTDFITDSPTEAPSPIPTEPPTPIGTLPFTAPLEGSAWTMRAGDAAQTGFVSEGLPWLVLGDDWAHNPQSSSSTGLAIGGGKVIFGIDGGVRAVDWIGGRLFGGWGWDSSLGADVSGQPALYLSQDPDAPFQRIVVSTVTGELHALDMADGSLTWSLSPDGMQGSVYSGVTVGPGGALYVATDTGLLLGVNPNDGTLYWEPSTFSFNDAFYSFPPAIASGLGWVFLSGSQRVYGLDLNTGAVWTVDTLGAPSTPPSVAEALDLVFVGTTEGWVYAFNLGTGEEAWPPVRASNSIVGLANGPGSDSIWRVFATASDGANQGQAFAWHAGDGQLAWPANLGIGTNAAPLIDGSYVLVGTHSGELRYYDVITGQEAAERHHTLRDGDPVLYTPSPAGGWLFVHGAYYVHGIGP